MIYRSSVSFVTLHLFLAKLRAFDLVNFSNQTVFRTLFLNACRYRLDFWHVSQSPWFTDQVWVLLCSIDFWPNYRPLTEQSNSFPDFFPRRLQILTWFLACESFTMIYRSSLSFITLHWFLAKLQALGLVTCSNQTVFRTLFLNTGRYWPDFWHVSQSPWFTDQVWVSLRFIDFWPNYGPFDSAIKQFSGLFS